MYIELPFSTDCSIQLETKTGTSSFLTRQPRNLEKDVV